MRGQQEEFACRCHGLHRRLDLQPTDSTTKGWQPKHFAQLWLAIHACRAAHRRQLVPIRVWKRHLVMTTCAERGKRSERLQASREADVGMGRECAG